MAQAAAQEEQRVNCNNGNRTTAKEGDKASMTPLTEAGNNLHEEEGREVAEADPHAEAEAAPAAAPMHSRRTDCTGAGAEAEAEAENETETGTETEAR